MINGKNIKKTADRNPIKSLLFNTYSVG